MRPSPAGVVGFPINTGDTSMIRITNTSTRRNGTRTEIHHDSYIAQRPEDCRDSIDQTAFELATEHGQTIRIGCVTAEIID